MVRELSPAELNILRLLYADRPVGPVTNWGEDRARQKLRRAGLIQFDRQIWSWRITTAGEVAMRSGRT